MSLLKKLLFSAWIYAILFVASVAEVSAIQTLNTGALPASDKHAIEDRRSYSPAATSEGPGYAWQFDGNSDVGWIPDNPLLSGGPGKSLTLEVWVKLETTVGTHPIVTKLLDGATKDWGMEIQYGTVIADIETDNDNWYFVTDTLVSPGAWTHVAFTFDNPGDIVRIYVNGIEAGSGKVQTKDMPDTDADILMGHHPYDPSRMKGILDEVRIWNYARSGDEIRQYMNKTLTGDEAGLIGYWQFDEGTGQYSADISGHGHRVQRGFTNASEADDPVWVISDAPLSATPFVSVTSPNGGERWFAGSHQQITWVAPATITQVTLQFSQNAGITWNTIVDRAPNTGAYSWLVPNAVSDQCLIRIFDADSSAIADTSDGVFSILLPSLTMAFPNGGEGFAVGSRQSIAWFTQGEIPRVNLAFSMDGGTIWLPLANNIANTDSYVWTVPDVPQKGYLVRVSDAADENPADASDHQFFIVTAGKINRALYFDRVDDFGFVPDNPLLSGGPGKSLTVEAWVNLDTVSGHHQIISKFFGDGNSKDWGMEAEFGRIVVDIENDADNWVYITGSISPGVWTHVAFAFDNTTDTVKVYVNGVQAGPGAWQPKDMPDTEAPILLGAHPYAPLHNAIGLIDEVRIWNYARSGAEIRANMTRLLAGGEPGLIGYWRFEEGRGQRSVDLTGNGNDVQLGATDSSDVQDPAWAISDAPLSDGSFLQVTTPRGGENWKAGSTQEITWVAPGISGEVKIEFSTDLQPVPMMPLGDSITRGDESTHLNGYRSTLYTLLTNAGIAFDFVGSLRDGNFPGDQHEGHSGWTTAQLLDSLAFFLANYTPRAVFLHIGTNDITDDITPDIIISNIGAIVDQIYSRDSQTEIYLALLIPRNDGKETNSNVLNNLIGNLVSEKRGLGYPIFSVNQYRPFKDNPNWATEYMFDKVHPNDTGYAVMAQSWFEAFILHSAYAQGSNNGTWQIIALSAPNSGSYNWLLPNIPSANCFVRISEALSGKPLDRSDHPFQIDSSVDVSNEHQNNLPAEFKLLGNYPNPLRASSFLAGMRSAAAEGTSLETKVVFQLPQRSYVRLAIYDLLGRELMLLVNEEREAGTHEAGWDGRDKTGRLLPTGIYIYSITAGGFSSSKKLVIIR